MSDFQQKIEYWFEVYPILNVIVQDTNGDVVGYSGKVEFDVYTGRWIGIGVNLRCMLGNELLQSDFDTRVYTREEFAVRARCAKKVCEVVYRYLDKMEYACYGFDSAKEILKEFTSEINTILEEHHKQ